MISLPSTYVSFLNVEAMLPSLLMSFFNTVWKQGQLRKWPILFRLAGALSYPYWSYSPANHLSSLVFRP